MTIRRIFAVLAVVSLAGCGGGGGNGSGGGGAGGSGATSVDLDAANALWLASDGGDALILYTYKGSATISLDVRDDPHGATKGQHTGSRTGTAAAGYTLKLDCLNPGTASCAALGDSATLDCTVGTSAPQLSCGSLTFDEVTSEDISQ